MPEMHLRQPGFTYSVCCPLTKNKKKKKRKKKKKKRNRGLKIYLSKRIR